MDFKSDDQESGTFQEVFQTEFYVWGDNLRGQCGSSTKSIAHPEKVLMNMVVRQLSCGQNHVAVITIGSGGTDLRGGRQPVRAAGSGRQGTQDDPFAGTRPEAADGQLHTGGLRQAPLSRHHGYDYEDGDCYAWGEGGNYCLGNGKTEDMFEPIKLDVANLSDISCGSTFSLFLNQDQDIFFCGIDILNISGHGFVENITKLNLTIKIQSIASASTYFALESQDSEFYFMGALSNINRLFSKPTKLPLDSPVQQIFSGYHVSVLTDSNKLYYLNDSNNNRIVFINPSGTGKLDLITEQDNMLESCFQEKVLDSYFQEKKGYILSEDSKVWRVLLGEEIKIEEIKELSDKDIRQLSCGDNFTITIGNVFRQSKKPEEQMEVIDENENQDELNMSPIAEHLRQSSASSVVLQQNTTNQDLFSFSLKKDLQLLNNLSWKKQQIKQSAEIQHDRSIQTQEVQYLQDQLIDELREENKRLKESLKQLQQGNEANMMFIQRLQEHNQRLSTENQMLKSSNSSNTNNTNNNNNNGNNSNNKKQIMEKIMQKKEELQAMIQGFYSEHNKIMSTIQNSRMK